MFEKLIVNGPLTMVFVKAEWCGACHRFNDEVWSHLTKLKNKNINLASVDSEMIGKTSLANVPRKFYPTLLLVGKDKKAATFLDENGSPTNAMPRNNSLSEDREAFTNLVQSVNLPEVGSTLNPTTVPKNSLGSNAKSSLNSVVPSINKSLGTSTVVSTTIGKSPFSNNISVPSVLTTEPQPPSATLDSMSLRAPVSVESTSLEAAPVAESVAESVALPVASPGSKSYPRSMPPDVGSDLVASQTKSVTGTAGVVSSQKGGRLLAAIRNKTASIRAMLRLRKSMPSFKSRNRLSRKVRR